MSGLSYSTHIKGTINPKKTKPIIPKALRGQLQKGATEDLTREFDEDELLVEDIDDYTQKETFQELFYPGKQAHDQEVKGRWGSVAKATAGGQLLERLKLKEQDKSVNLLKYLNS